MKSDGRLTPANGRVAAIELEDTIAAQRQVAGSWLRCTSPTASLLSVPGGEQVSQILYGEKFRLLECRAGWAFGQMERDGYVGYAEMSQFGATGAATHFVTSLWSPVFSGPDIKSPTSVILPFGSRLEAAPDNSQQEFLSLAAGGHVLAVQACPLDTRLADHASTAERFLGTPYLWGGNSPAGVDCSGLVQMSLTASGLGCPRDSDQQEVALGESVADLGELRRGDLVFWPGHVGIMLDPEVLLHATAHWQSVVREPLRKVADRIRTKGEKAPARGRRLQETTRKSCLANTPIT